MSLFGISPEIEKMKNEQRKAHQQFPRLSPWDIFWWILCWAGGHALDRLIRMLYPLFKRALGWIRHIGMRQLMSQFWSKLKPDHENVALALISSAGSFGLASGVLAVYGAHDVATQYFAAQNLRSYAVMMKVRAINQERIAYFHFEE